MNGKQIIDQEDFSFEGIEYTARLYHPQGKNLVYGEIVYKENGERPYRKMRDIARQYLKPYRIEIPTEASSNVTHVAVKKLIAVIREEKK